ncbi:hypothetical protein B0T20DRAFT_401721 [Sordaria brevicollis]|uniref:Uncharacterized protein n=1 Tax=Sordaria brevicollis TaxID=83679 RepID=A0AAE0PK82_SORBR|nr:hypothetical protein B0T20DRAFT_401721 [Sordaria brevicollis]
MEAVAVAALLPVVLPRVVPVVVVAELLLAELLKAALVHVLSRSRSKVEPLSHRRTRIMSLEDNLRRFELVIRF